MVVMMVVMLVAGCGASAAPRREPVAVVPAQSASTSVAPAPLPLHWVGEWSSPPGGSPEQISFTFDIRLAPVANGAVNGRILWTLMSAPPAHFLASRVGDSGTEYVRGEWSPESSTLHLTGTSVDSPGFLVVDEYRLVVSADRSSIDGPTRGSKGDWKNSLHGRRAD